MKKADILSWLKNEFKPLTLATPDDPTLNQIIDNAIRYWNTHSGYKISTMTEAKTKVQLPAAFKTVVQVFPDVQYIPVLVDFSNTLLLGMTVLDNVVTDMILMSEGFKSYKSYISGQFRWRFEKDDDPTKGGYLYTYNIPSGVSKFFCVGTKRILSGEDVTSEYVLDWVLYYSKALLKITEGNTLRKSDIVNIKNDGDRLVNEGFDEKKDLEDRLGREARWVCLAGRA